MVDQHSVQTLAGAPRSQTKTRGLVIAQIIGGLNVGGAERHFVNLINALSDNDRIAIYLGQKRNGPTLHSQVCNQVAQAHNLIRRRWFPFGILALAKKLIKHKCNVVHTHMFWANLCGTVAARLAGIPVIITTEHGENRWKKAHHRWLERNVISRIADMRYCVSREILAQRRDVDGVPANKLQVIANGTVVPVAPTDLWSNAEPVIGSVGRFVLQKDFGLFVDIVATLRRRGYAVRGCIVGDGPEMHGIRRKISDAGLDSMIKLPGFDTDIDGWYRYFDIYAITSKEEGLPVSLLEAMSYGLPVVASDVGAISTAIRSGEEGTVVAVGNTRQFVDAIANYLDNRDLAVKIGRKARERVVNDFSIEAIAARYEACYREILDR